MQHDCNLYTTGYYDSTSEAITYFVEFKPYSESRNRVVRLEIIHKEIFSRFLLKNCYILEGIYSIVAYKHVKIDSN